MVLTMDFIYILAWQSIQCVVYKQNTGLIVACPLLSLSNNLFKYVQAVANNRNTIVTHACQDAGQIHQRNSP